MHVSPAPQLNLKLLVATVGWWINPTHSHKCNYFICQRLGRPRRAPCTRSIQRRNEWRLLPHHFALVFISCKVCPVQLNNSYNHSVRAKVIISSIPFGPVKDITSGIWVSHQSRYHPPFTHTRIHTRMIAVWHSPEEWHALFSNMLTSIKEGSHKLWAFFYVGRLGWWLTSVVMGAVMERWWSDDGCYFFVF